MVEFGLQQFGIKNSGIPLRGTEMVELFERANEPPYYGSYHFLVFDILHPSKFQKHGKNVKEVYKGHYVLDQRQGYGVYDWGNGYLYKGSFANDIRNGEG